MDKLNCWEFKDCGRETGGSKAGELGVCPASEDGRLDGVHQGKNGGRSCWVLAGTMCGGAIQGSFAKKYESCTGCEFYHQVRKEENGSYQMSITLLNKLKAFEPEAG